MKLLILIVLLCTLCVQPCLSQPVQGKKLDPLQLSDAERVDTLVKYVRTQFYSNNYGQTIEIGGETIKLARRIDDRNAIFRVSSLMGNAFLQLYDTVQAKRIFFSTIHEAERLNDTTRSLTTARIDLGNLYALQEKNDLAILKYKEAIPLAEKLNDSTHLFILNYNIAELSLDMKKLEASEYHVAKTVEYVKSVKSEAYHAVAKLVTGRLFRLKNDPEGALPHLEESILLAEKSGYTEALIEAYQVAAEVQIDLGNFESATNYLLEADEIKSEKYKADKIQSIETVTAKFKLDQYKQDLTAQALQNKIDLHETKRETTSLWIKIASGILFVFSIVLFISYIKRKKLLKDLLKKNKQYLEAKDESEAQAEAKNRLFSNITHELRTPLYGIIGISSLLLDDKKMEHQVKNLNSLKFSADFLLSLINNVLQFTRMDTQGTQILRQAEFDLRDLINSVVESSKFLNTSKPNDYRVKIDDAVPNLLLGDDIKLSQILMNLVSNASKFTHHGTINIQVERKVDEGDRICLKFSIRDTGIGISKKRQEHLFDEFSDTGSNYEHQGTGLGLPIVKKLLNLFGSELRLHSEPGKGTDISFTLYFNETEVGQLDGSSLEVAPTSFAGKNILVVDDNKINQLVTKKTLEKHHASVLVAGNGRQAIDLVKTEKLDLILMDINMPEMNGFEATEIIRSLGQKTPVLALTAVEEEKVLIKNTNDLFNDFIIKPYKNEEFLLKISLHLNAS